MNLTNVLVKLRDDIKIWTTNNLSELKTRLNTHANTAEIHTTANEKNKVSLTNIGYGECATAANVAEKTVTITTNPEWKLEPGAIVFIKFANTNTATGVTLNVNETGPKSIWGSSAIVTGTSSAYTGYKNRIIGYVYDGTQYVWTGSSHMVSYSNPALGQGYATCSTAAATAAKTASLSSYSLQTGGIVSIKFSNDVPANATLNVNSKGAKSIYYRGSKITAGVIHAGDIATFMYSSYYHLISIDKPVYSKTEIDNKLDGKSTSTHIHLIEYTPAGTVSKPGFTGSSATTAAADSTNKTTIKSVTNVGTAPSATFSSGTLPSHAYTAPSLSGSVSNRCLSLSWNAGSHTFSTGSLPSLDFKPGSVPTVQDVSLSTPTHTHNFVATGTVSQPTFTGSSATINTSQPK